MCRNQVRGVVTEVLASSYESQSTTGIDISGANSVGVVATLTPDIPYYTGQFVFNAAIAIATHQDKYIKWTIDGVQHIFFLNVDDAGTLVDDTDIFVYPIAVADEATALQVATAAFAVLTAAAETINMTVTQDGTTLTLVSTIAGVRATELTRHGSFPAAYTGILDGSATPEVTGTLALQVSNDNSVFVNYGSATTLTAVDADTSYQYSIVTSAFKYARVNLVVTEGYSGLTIKTLVTI